jgi:hypothetical protein
MSHLKIDVFNGELKITQIEAEGLKNQSVNKNT